jgi:hypothetical protein
MSPIDYVEEYHGFRVVMPDLLTSSMILRYQSKPDPKQKVEYFAVASALIQKFKIKATGPYAMPNEFYVQGHATISPGEVFYTNGLIRAYDCRGTPEEIRDAVRLAVAAGRCDANSAPAYVTKWFGLDCNTLVGNWMGLSSGTAIFAYVKGYGTAPLAGGTPADEATRGFLPFPAAPTLQSVGEGSVLVTYSPKRPENPDYPDKFGMRFWEHIALIQSFSVISEEGADSAKGVVSIVEWGQAGGPAEHIKMSAPCELVRGKFVKERPGQVFWAIKSGESYRLILNMPPAIASGERRKYGVPSNASL